MVEASKTGKKGDEQLTWGASHFTMRLARLYLWHKIDVICVYRYVYGALKVTIHTNAANYEHVIYHNILFSELVFGF